MFGKISAFSAHPLKNLNALGDGGFDITSDKKFYDKIKLYRNHGLKGRDNVEIIGVNSRLEFSKRRGFKFSFKRLKNIIKRRTININIYTKKVKTKKVKFIDKNIKIRLMLM